MVPSLSSLPNRSITFEKNVWADFVELSCLKCIDQEISLSDMIDIALLESSDGPDRGSDATSEQEDDYRLEFSDIFRYLKNRSQILGDFYPFLFVDDDTISIDLASLSIKQKVYLFLLYCSNLSRFTKSDLHVLTKEFEVLSQVVLERIFPTYHVEVFGTASKPTDMFHGRNLVDRMKKLAECMHTELTLDAKNNERYSRPNGDGGMDLVGFFELDNDDSGVPFIPLCFAQCACSVDQWKNKQSSIQYDLWNRRFTQLPHYCEFIFVPFSLRGPDGKWSSTEADQIVVIPIDRIRFLHILTASDNTLAFFLDTRAKEIVDTSIAQLTNN